MENPQQMTDTILSAVRITGVRAIISKGWSKLGTGITDPNVLFLDDCPHGKFSETQERALNDGVVAEWLFKHVAAVIHHGGAGTTACGLLNGRPTTIVPFFGE